MKKRLLFLSLGLLALLSVDVTLAQSPEQFKYQAVLRDATGNPIVNTAKTVIINILQGSATGTSVYQETHSVTTTAQGVINLNIGGGTVNAGVFATINWCANPYWVKVTVDGTVISTGQLLSVPYSLHVKGINVVSGNVGIGTTNPQNKLHVAGFIQLEGNPDAQVLFGTTGANGKRGIGSLAGWDATKLYVNGWGDFTGGVSIGKWGGTTETSDLYVNGNYNWAAGKNFVMTPPYSAPPNDYTFDFQNDDGNGIWGVYGPTYGYILSARNNGNVGIGISSPLSKLHVVGSDPRTNLLVECSSTTFGPEVRLTSTATGGHEWRIVSGASASNTYGAGSFELWDQTAAASRFGILPNGNVGIATFTPGEKLDVNGNVRISNNNDLKLVASSSAPNDPGDVAFFNNDLTQRGRIWMDQTSATGGMQIVANSSGSPNVYIANNGNVGIGTTSPAAKLDVVGTVRIADGTQGANKVLTSDASGNASWVTNTGVTSAVMATLSSTSYTLNNLAGQYTGSYITLPPGKWSVQINMLLPNVACCVWVRSGFSTSSSSFISPGADIIGSSLASGYKAANAYGMLIGTIVINNTSGSSKTYYYWAEGPEIYSGTYSLPDFGTGIAMENQMIAYPMN
ncbi:MAG: hypothetical protein ISS17_09370 [Bacteroidales bacterium]|nr:hypothetical protein [Bacteroidales bacterium]